MIESTKLKILGKLKQLSWRLHWIAPNNIPLIGFGSNPNTKKFDRKDNSRTQLPSNINVSIEQLIAVELFGPAEINLLYSKLEEFGWTQDRYARKTSPSDWIRRERAYGHGGSWLNLGLIARRKDRRAFPEIHNHAVLPEIFDYIDIGIFQITPSITALSIVFYTNDSIADTYRKELNKDRRTYSIRSKNWSITRMSPGAQKSAAITKLRESMRASCRDWIADHFPGVFSAINRLEAFPTMEIMVCEGYALSPPPDSGKTSFESWRNKITKISPRDVWVHARQPGLQLAFCEFSFEDPSIHTIVTVDYGSFPEEEFEVYGGKSRRQLADHVRHDLEYVLIHQSCSSYIKEKNKELNTTRETIESLSKSHKKTKRVIERIQDFFSRTAGTRILSKEINELCTANSFYSTNINFHQQRENENTKALLGYLAQRALGFHSKKLMQEEAELRSHLEQITTILNTVESISAQRRMEMLTVLAVLVAIGSLWVALPDFTKLAETLTSLFQWSKLNWISLLSAD